MTDEYQDLGLKCGIEIHQRLDTHKLFCGCSSDLAEGDPILEVRRKLRAVAGELGEVDRAALHEYLRNRDFLYQVYEGRTCLVELDEEPPSPLNQEALDIGLEAVLLLEATIPDEVHVMRKTVIDGSNTSGFQRTCVIGMDGSMEGPRGRLEVPTICLEEEAAGIGGGRDGSVVYKLDRQGIALVEVATGIMEGYLPEEVQEVAHKIGMILRMTGKVQRGIGTIRQDVNVSISGGARVEIKGFQEIGKLADLVRNEVQRQRSLITIKETLSGRRASISDPRDVTELFRGLKKGVVASIVKGGGRVLALCLGGFGGLLGRELCPGRSFGRELADHAKAQGVGGIIHSDEDLGKMGLAEAFRDLADELKADEGDALLIVAGKGGAPSRAISAVKQRLEWACRGIPEETREPNPDGTSNYKRPLPGSSRMYPETDIPPIPISGERIEDVRGRLPETPEVVRERLVDSGMSDDLAEQLVRDVNLPLFERILGRTGMDTTLLANTLVNTFRSLRRDGVDVDGIPEDDLVGLFTAVSQSRLVKEEIDPVLREIAGGRAVEDAVGEREGIDEGELRKIVEEILQSKADLVAERGERSFGPVMGEVMKQVRGKIDGGLVGRVVKELLERQLREG